MKLNGVFGPELDDGYKPGAWDEVRQAFMDGHISPQAYDVLYEALEGQLDPQPEKEGT